MVKRICLICLLMCLGPTVQAQSARDSLFFLDASSDFSVINNSFTDTWNASPAAHIKLRFPYHTTQLEAGLRYTRFNNRTTTEEDADFHSLYLHIGMLFPIQFTSAYSVAPAIRFGNNLMIFDAPAVFTNNSGTEQFVTDQSESEFSYELALQNRLQISDRWALHFTLSYNRTLTYYPLSSTFLSVGISRSFVQPTWLQTFFK